MALPHHPRPAEAKPSAAAPGKVGGRQSSRPGVRGSQSKDGGPANKKERGGAAGPGQALKGMTRLMYHHWC